MIASPSALEWSPSPEPHALPLVGLPVERNARPAATGCILAAMVLTIAGFFAGLAVVRSLVSVPV
ncbi:hypothetical protein JJL56_14230 [Azospirillum sp. YIM DDC1]|uniref:Uncharacterized protein n=1 Tax=Azospirillum aestuarii TaxID=2802052 RepID=A0ABS1HYX9_9PROT|nr:hypothetical protein [Azospirillum aestuarii]MBK4720028.1 hypothetical protein [Azospirillum aestuarii]